MKDSEFRFGGCHYAKDGLLELVVEHGNMAPSPSMQELKRLPLRAVLLMGASASMILRSVRTRLVSLS